MAVKDGYVSVQHGRIFKAYSCSHCGKFLGTYEADDNGEVDTMYEWEYCPFCGVEL